MARIVCSEAKIRGQWMPMKSWKLAAIENSQVVAPRCGKHVRTLLFALLGLLACAIALATDVVVRKGPAATLNNALLRPYRVLNSTHGLPQNTVYALANGPDGVFMWARKMGFRVLTVAVSRVSR